MPRTNESGLQMPTGYPQKMSVYESSATWQRLSSEEMTDKKHAWLQNLYKLNDYGIVVYQKGSSRNVAYVFMFDGRLVDFCTQKDLKAWADTAGLASAGRRT